MIQHLAKMHKLEINFQSFMQAAHACMVGKTYPSIPTDPVSPVWGLITYPAFKCVSCAYFAIDLTSVLNHFDCEHANDRKQSQWKQIYVQHLGSELLELQFQVLKPDNEKISPDMTTFTDTILQKVDTRLHTQLQSFQASFTVAIQKSIKETIRKELQTHANVLTNSMKHSSSSSLFPDNTAISATSPNQLAATHRPQTSLNTENTSGQQVQNPMEQDYLEDFYADVQAPLTVSTQIDAQPK